MVNMPAISTFFISVIFEMNNMSEWIASPYSGVIAENRSPSIPYDSNRELVKGNTSDVCIRFS